jgi:hypothetical protein
MKTPRLKKRHKILLALVLLVSAILFAAPRVAGWYLVKNSVELTGRKLAVGKVRLNYFTGTLTVHDLQFFEADGSTVFVSFRRLKINLDYLPLIRNEISVKYIILDDPYAQVIQSGDLFNFSDLMTADSVSVSADTVPSKPLKYIIGNITIARGFLKYTDKLLNHTIEMNRLDLNIPGFTWNSDSTRLGVDFRFVDGGRLFSDLAINQADSTYQVSLRLDSLNLDIIEPYVKSSLNISGLTGYLSNDIRITGDMRSIMQLSVSGKNEIFSFNLTDTLNRKIFAFDRLSLDIDTLLPGRNIVKIKTIDLKNPYIYFELIDSVNNWLTLMKPEPAALPDSLAAADSIPAAAYDGVFQFSRLTVTGGSVDISDKTLRYPFSYNIGQLGVESYPDRTRAGWIDVKMKAELNGNGIFSADLAMDLLNTDDIDISLSANQFRMKDTDPYFRHYFAFPVTDGRLNFKTSNKLRKNSVVSDNSIYFRKFILGKKTAEKAEYNLPLRLGLGVMSDKDGVIDLKVPVEMEGENVRIRNLRKIIFHAVGTLFIKAAVSPFNMIGDLFNTDPEKLKEIGLPLIDAVPGIENMKTVDILADVLSKKPGLTLDLVYCLNREKEADTLARFIATGDYLKATGTSGPVADSILVKFIAGRISADSALAATGPGPLCLRYAGAERLNAAIDSVRSGQAAYLRKYLELDRGIPAERFRIEVTMPDSIKYDSALPAFRTYFGAGDAN